MYKRQIAYNKGERFLVIVENNGAIPNMPADAMVEVCLLYTSKDKEIKKEVA